MQHYALYRKYRPMTFSEVAGQSHVTLTLRRQIQNSSISHAYLFTGTRGTGKTSCARIFARAINCLDPHDGEPCNKCDTCLGLLDGSIFDVTEIDAASNNSVDNIRQLREEIVYTPISAKYKVYIIDEVHMLSSGAFNALLKTLEEPPAHAVFILATTEPHKVPATILSRCQRFDFFRLNIKTLSAELNRILALEGKTLDAHSISLIASLAEGSARDALSVLEKALEMDSADGIEQILGVIGRGTLYETVKSIAAGDVDALYSLIGSMFFASKDMTILIDELSELFREMLIAKSSQKYDMLLDESEDDLIKIKEHSELFTEDFLLYALHNLRETRQILAKSPDTRADTELCMLRLAKPELSFDTASLTARLEAVERKLAALQRNGVRPVSEQPSVPKKEETAVPKKEEAVAPRPKAPTPKPEPSSTPVVQPEPEQSNKPQPEQSAPKADEVVLSDGKWKQLDSFEVIADCVTDQFTKYTLKNACIAVYRGDEVKILCNRSGDLEIIKSNMAKIKAAFEQSRRYNKTITAEVCADKSKYITSTDYENLENSELFSFGDEE